MDYWTPIIAATPPTLVALCSLITSLRNKKQIQEVKVSIDGRMEELLALTRKSSHAEGVLDQKTETQEPKKESAAFLKHDSAG